MRHLITIILVITATGIASGQKISYSEWKKETKVDIRLLPKYGEVPKTKEQKLADQELIDDYVKQEGNRTTASELLVRLGFNYLYKGDLKTAMYRFNQAWILDPENPNCFWGFGAIYFTFGDYENALKQYDDGLKVDANSSNILTDKATVFMTKYMNNHIDTDYNEALTFFRKSYSINPKNQNTLFKLSVCYFQKKDCENALFFYNECKKLGGRHITKEFTEALNEECKK
jgi:tetratricopeptide (TPR) repeat protein